MIEELAAKFKAEESRIRSARLAAWCSVGAEQAIMGIECAPLTVRAWLDLSLAENSVMEGKHPTPAEACAYVWRNCKAFEVGNPRKQKRWQKIIAKAFKKHGYFAALADIGEHVQTAFEELPRSQSSSGVQINNGCPDIEGIVGAIDEVAARYGVAPDVVTEWPLNRLFQLQRAARLATIPGYKLRQPESLMALRREYLQAINSN